MNTQEVQLMSLFDCQQKQREKAWFRFLTGLVLSALAALGAYMVICAASCWWDISFLLEIRVSCQRRQKIN